MWLLGKQGTALEHGLRAPYEALVAETQTPLTMVLLLNGNFASTTVRPIEEFHSAGVLWNTLQGQAPEPRFRVRIATIRGKSVRSAYHLGLVAARQTDHRGSARAV